MSQRRVEVVGPVVSSELRMTGFIAVAAGLLAIVAYVWFRFEWQFAAGAIVGLTHDVLLTIGLFSLFQLEFDLSIVAALLTILGYSVNDTVVVSDRIRENLRKYKRMELNELLNLSINETLSRTVLTGSDGAGGADLALHLRRRGAAQLQFRDAVRRTHRHLFVDLHRGSAARISGRQARLEQRQGRDTERGGQTGLTRASSVENGMATQTASYPGRAAHRSVWQWRVSVRGHEPPRIDPLPAHSIVAWDVAVPERA